MKKKKYKTALIAGWEETFDNPEKIIGSSDDVLLTCWGDDSLYFQEYGMSFSLIYQGDINYLKNYLKIDAGGSVTKKLENFFFEVFNPFLGDNKGYAQEKLNFIRVTEDKKGYHLAMSLFFRKTKLNCPVCNAFRDCLAQLKEEGANVWFGIEKD